MQRKQTTVSLAPAAGDACPDEEVLLLFLEHQLDPPGARALQTHLAGCARCRLTAQTAVSGEDEPAVGTPGPRTFDDGRLIAGRYWVLRLLGCGGMGEVYEVEDRLLPGTRLALKTLPSTHLDDRRALARFRAEVLLARRVSSPHVCRILEFGIHDEGCEGAVPFLTMELLSGETLAARLARAGRLDQAQVARLAAQMIDGLQAVHRAGIIHRDFKPENVFLVREPGAGGPEHGVERAVVLDFGLARSFIEPAGRGCSTGALVVGTPAYVAPEQVEGKPAGPASDVYSLGVVLFEMFAGQRPFSGASPLEIATARLQTPPPPLSSLVSIGPPWERVVAGCLARDAAQRFRDMDAVAAAIGGSAAAPRSAEPRSTRPLVMALIAAVLTTVGPAPGPAPAPTPPAVTRTAAAAAPVATVIPVPDRPALVALAPVAPAQQLPSRVPPRPLAVARALLRAGKTDEACARLLQGRPDADRSAPVYRLLGKCYMRRGRIAEAKAHYRRYLELAPGADDAPFVRGILNR